MVDIISYRKTTTDEIDIRLSHTALRQIIVNALLEKFPEIKKMRYTVGLNVSGILTDSSEQGAYLLAKKTVE